MSALEVDQFTLPQARQEFQGRYDQLVQVVGRLGLEGAGPYETPAQAYGGGALVLQGIDGYIPSQDPFDFEMVVCEAMFRRIDDAYGLGVRSKHSGSLLPRHGFPLPIDLAIANTPHEGSKAVGLEPYTGKISDTIVMTPSGILATNASVIAELKTNARYSRVKDLAGVVKAHVVAASTEHPIIHDEAWLQSVSRAMDRLTRRDIRSPLDRKFLPPKPRYPSWLKQLVKVEFNHEAFENVPRVK